MACDSFDLTLSKICKAYDIVWIEEYSIVLKLDLVISETRTCSRSYKGITYLPGTLNIQLVDAALKTGHHTSFLSI